MQLNIWKQYNQASSSKCQLRVSETYYEMISSVCGDLCAAKRNRMSMTTNLLVKLNENF